MQTYGHTQNFLFCNFLSHINEAKASRNVCQSASDPYIAVFPKEFKALLAQHDALWAKSNLISHLRVMFVVISLYAHKLVQGMDQLHVVYAHTSTALFAHQLMIVCVPDHVPLLAYFVYYEGSASLQCSLIAPKLSNRSAN